MRQTLFGVLLQLSVNLLVIIPLYEFTLLLVISEGSLFQKVTLFSLDLFILLDFYCNLELSVSKGKICAFSVFPDGIHRVVALCTLRVTIITDDMLTNSITVRLENMSQERFLSPLLSLFLEGVADVLSTKREAVFVFNIQNDTDVQGSILNVTFSALQPGGAPGKGMFFPSEELQEQIYLHRTRLRLISTQEVTHSPEVKNIRSVSRRNKCS